MSFDGREVNPPALCAITDGVYTPYGNGLCNYTNVMGPRVSILDVNWHNLRVDKSAQHGTIPHHA